MVQEVGRERKDDFSVFIKGFFAGWQRQPVLYFWWWFLIPILIWIQKISRKDQKDPERLYLKESRQIEEFFNI